MGRFTDKVVLVTGGASGLGADTAELFIQDGAKVFVVDLDDRGILKRLGSNAHYQKCDVSSPEDCEAAIKGCVEKFGKLNVLFHNAGTLAAPGSVVDVDVKTFQRVINVNLCGFFYLSRVAIPEMIKQGGGAIVATASTSGLFGDYGLCAYTASKHGTIGLAKDMSLDHAKDNIRVNCVCPGYMITPMTEGFKQNPVVYEKLVGGIPMQRGSDPKEIGRAVLFLASNDASFITGQNLVIDGGSTAHSGMPNFLKYMGPEASHSAASAPVANGVPGGHKKKISISQKTAGLFVAQEED